MKIDIEDNLIIINGECVIDKLEPLKKTMLDLLESKYKSIKIDLTGIRAIDSTGIQLLAVCRNTALGKKKNFYISAKSKEVSEALQITGLETILQDSPGD